MSEPNSPTDESADRVYRFISDPGHKENLSGRVRAACLTCRRKKIKCSGDINCRTCREKGLVCEGLPERKRPSKDTTGSLVLGPVSSGIERKRRASPPKKASLRRPSATLKPTDSTDSRDSGYSSTRGDIANHSASPASSTGRTGLSAQSKPMFTLPFKAPGATQHSPQTGLRIDTWHLNDVHTDLDQSTEYDHSAVEPPSAISSQLQPDSAAVSETSLDWSHFQQDIGWWPGQPNDGQDCTNMAQVLADQAQSLRFSGPRQQYSEVSNMQSRRQTIAFPLESPSMFEPRYDMLENQHGVFDDMALLLTQRTPRTCLTPNVTEFASWWDINGVGDMAAFFGNGNVSLSGGQNDQAPFQSETLTSQSLQEPPRQPTVSDDSYFSQYWPD